MADLWLGYSVAESHDETRRALAAVDASARLLFVSSAGELRQAVQTRQEPVGAIVGPLSKGVSPLNLAAAIARDGMAAQVVLAVAGPSAEYAERARQAGIDTVLDLSLIGVPEMSDLDEPDFSCDDVPTVLMGRMASAGSVTLRVPQVEVDAAPLSVHGRASSVSCGHGDASPKRAAAKKATALRGCAPLITFVSGRGGVGKTSAVAAMAYAAASWGMRVALCDLDLWFGNLYSCFGARGPADLAPLAKHGQEGPDAFLSCGKVVSKGVTLWGPCEVPESAEAVYEWTKGLLEALVGSYDLVLVDTSATFTDATAQAVQQSDRLVLTVDGRRGTGSTQARLAALALRLGMARTRIVRLANRCGRRDEPEINRANPGLEAARPLRLLDGGRDVEECLAAGRVSDLFELGNRFAESSATAMAALLSELGRLPVHPEAERALRAGTERPRWSLAFRREAV